MTLTKSNINWRFFFIVFHVYFLRVGYKQSIDLSLSLSLLLLHHPSWFEQQQLQLSAHQCSCLCRIWERFERSVCISFIRVFTGQLRVVNKQPGICFTRKWSRGTHKWHSTHMRNVKIIQSGVCLREGLRNFHVIYVYDTFSRFLFFSTLRYLFLSQVVFVAHWILLPGCHSLFPFFFEINASLGTSLD